MKKSEEDLNGQCEAYDCESRPLCSNVLAPFEGQWFSIVSTKIIRIDQALV